MSTRVNVLYKALYPRLCALKGSFKTVIASIYCFAARPEVQAILMYMNL